MKTMITVIVLCVFAYAGAGAFLKTADAEQAHAIKTNNAVALLETK